MGDIAEALVELLRKECLARGFNGIKGLSVVFRAMDIDYSKRITFDELKEGIKKFGLTLPDNYIHLLFVAFDINKSGGIDFCEFMHKLRPPLSKCRKDVINEAFDRLDVNNDGSISIEDLKVVYASNIKQHPKILSGEWTEEKALKQFLNTIDSPECPDGKVTREEFMNYYSGVSSMVEDDAYFDLTMRSCFALPPKGTTN
ncbi:hypothetical protein ACJMK2_035231 [Sinanodonta woodiana]|uniref:EF-hand domain-containing protein n=1 Tax=Sinanodonta woodiana TaxID=1069815 RepID=A0ABD3WU94_SINWO